MSAMLQNFYKVKGMRVLEVACVYERHATAFLPYGKDAMRGHDWSGRSYQDPYGAHLLLCLHFCTACPVSSGPVGPVGPVESVGSVQHIKLVQLVQLVLYSMSSWSSWSSWFCTACPVEVPFTS